MEALHIFSLSLGFVLWFIILCLCIQFQEKLCKCSWLQNVKNVGECELHVMYENHEEEVPSLYLSLATSS